MHYEFKTEKETFFDITAVKDDLARSDLSFHLELQNWFGDLSKAISDFKKAFKVM